jgi:aminomethyltransferase
MSDLIHSPLHDRHVALGAKFAEFGGWEMPLQYSGIVAEHRAVRTAVGLFDVSHLGTLKVTGPGAVEFLNTCLSNDLDRIAAGQAQYSLVCNDLGGVVDDLIAYRFSDDEVLLSPTSANAATVAGLLAAAAPAGITIENVHADYAILAVQGTASDEVLDALGLPTGQDYMSFAHGTWGGPITVCRTGYTGERGYELVVAADRAPSLWDALVAAGGEYDLLPCGLGARDTLRTEMGYALHGHELSPEISPLQAGVGWAVGWRKPSFWGSDALRAEKQAGPARVLRGLLSAGRGIPRPGMTVVDAAGEPAGTLTSGTFSPTLGKGIGLALVRPDLALGEAVGVDVRGRIEQFELVKPPFVTPAVREA